MTDFSDIYCTGGEIVELGNRINRFGESMYFNCCTTAKGALAENLEKPIDGTTIEEGDWKLLLKNRG